MTMSRYLMLASMGFCLVQRLCAFDISTQDLGLIPDGQTLQTRALQRAIDRIASSGGGRLVVTPGIYLTGALHFKPGVGLHLEKGAVLKGSDSIVDYPLELTRIRGETRKYFPALINAVGCDHFRLTG